MPGKMARSDPRPSVQVTRGVDSGQHLASVLQEGRENANIDAGLGFIWRISVLIVVVARNRPFSEQVGKIVGVCRVAQEERPGHMEDFLHGAQIRRVREKDRAGKRLAVHVMLRKLSPWRMLAASPVWPKKPPEVQCACRCIDWG